GVEPVPVPRGGRGEIRNRRLRGNPRRRLDHRDRDRPTHRRKARVELSAPARRTAHVVAVRLSAAGRRADRLGRPPPRRFLSAPSAGPSDGAGPLDVVPDGGHELLERPEAALLADRAPELDDETLAV